MQEFLRGAEESMTTKGVQSFKGLRVARNHAAKWMKEEQKEATFQIEAVKEDGDVFLTITKTREWFSDRQYKLRGFMCELKILTELYEDSARESPSKRAREE